MDKVGKLLRNCKYNELDNLCLKLNMKLNKCGSSSSLLRLESEANTSSQGSIEIRKILWSSK